MTNEFQHVSAHAVERTYVLSDVRFQSFPGLLAVELAVGNQTSHVICRWESSQAASLAGPALSTALRMAAAPTLEGSSLSQIAPRAPLWRRITKAQYLLSVVAVLGSLEALRHHYAWLVGSAAHTLSMQGSGPCNVIDGSTFTIGVDAINTSGEASEPIVVWATDVSFHDPHFLGKPSIVEASRTSGDLLVGRSHRMQITGIADACGTHGVVDTAIELKTEAALGILWPNVSRTLSCPIAIWPRFSAEEAVLDRTYSLELESQPAEYCIVTAELLLGEGLPSGTEIEVTVLESEDVVVDAMAPVSLFEESFKSNTKDLDVNGPPDQQVSMLVVRCSEIPAFRRLRAELHLRADKPREQDSWRNIVRRIRIERL